MRPCIVVGIMLIMLGAVFAEVAEAENSGMQIDAILESGSIVLNDVTYDIAANAVFYGRDMRSRIPLSGFEEGDRVVLIIGPDGKITHMWLSSE